MVEGCAMTDSSNAATRPTTSADVRHVAPALRLQRGRKAEPRRVQCAYVTHAPYCAMGSRAAATLVDLDVPCATPRIAPCITPPAVTAYVIEASRTRRLAWRRAGCGYADRAPSRHAPKSPGAVAEKQQHLGSPIPGSSRPSPQVRGTYEQEHDVLGQTRTNETRRGPLLHKPFHGAS